MTFEILKTFLQTKCGQLITQHARTRYQRSAYSARRSEQGGEGDSGGVVGGRLAYHFKLSRLEKI